MFTYLLNQNSSTHQEGTQAG